MPVDWCIALSSLHVPLCIADNKMKWFFFWFYYFNYFGFSLCHWQVNSDEVCIVPIHPAASAFSTNTCGLHHNWSTLYTQQYSHNEILSVLLPFIQLTNENEKTKKKKFIYSTPLCSGYVSRISIIAFNLTLTHSAVSKCAAYALR